ncbi:hypothetical protein [Actinocrinis sp.]|uniref:hypothetical protein n=1 Tax=Actinocrinis sp. TaxID=1920516 RepID=UPI002C2F0606|nr:hypothetical protein [Actinocrinis sp.]HXR72518.1 hypothetical protein [Actinocrinis sp.]
MPLPPAYLAVSNVFTALRLVPMSDRAAEPMDFTGRVMRNFIYLDPAGVPDDAELGAWLRPAVAAVAAPGPPPPP